MHHVDYVLDSGPTGCGELIMNLFKTMKKLESNQIIEVISCDLGAREDIPAWCRLQGHMLLDCKRYGTRNHYYIRKK